MSDYLGKSFDRAIGRMFISAVVAFIGVVVTAFMLGRCSQSVSFQSPTKVEQQKESGK